MPASLFTLVASSSEHRPFLSSSAFLVAFLLLLCCWTFPASYLSAGSHWIQVTPRLDQCRYRDPLLHTTTSTVRYSPNLPAPSVGTVHYHDTVYIRSLLLGGSFSCGD